MTEWEIDRVNGFWIRLDKKDESAVEEERAVWPMKLSMVKAEEKIGLCIYKTISLDKGGDKEENKDREKLQVLGFESVKRLVWEKSDILLKWKNNISLKC